MATERVMVRTPGGQKLQDWSTSNVPVETGEPLERYGEGEWRDVWRDSHSGIVYDDRDYKSAIGTSTGRHERKLACRRHVALAEKDRAVF
jgi:hypothetical protein